MRKNLIVLLIALILPSAARATLGEKVSSVEQNRSLLSARIKTTTVTAAYSVHPLETDSGTIRQYATTDGTVFAITWEGLRHPDLTSLLGKYFSDFQRSSASSKRARGRRSLRVVGSSVVVEKWGPMRNQHGRAYDPNLIPSGVNVNDLE